MTATGFDFDPLPTGDVLIQFFADDGETINAQAITRDTLARLPVVVHAFFLAVEKGKEAALAFLNGVIAEGVDQHSSHVGTTDLRSGGDR